MVNRIDACVLYIVIIFSFSQVTGVTYNNCDWVKLSYDWIHDMQQVIHIYYALCISSLNIRTVEEDLASQHGHT